MIETLWKYSISPKTLSIMIDEGKSKYPKETGGILIGRQLEQIFFIETVIGPGPNAFHKMNGFKRDGDFSQSRLDNMVVETCGHWDYIGEWHSHPRKMVPSTIDISSLVKIQTSSKFNILQPILGLIINTRGEWKFHCYILSQSQEIIEIPMKEG